MDTVYLRSLLLADKDFLSKLFTNSPRKNKLTLSNADEKKLNTLIKVLHLVCNGHIKVRKQDFERIKRSKRMPFLKRTFEKKASYIHTLKLTRIEKQKLLVKLISVYKYLFHYLFFLE